jgi:hypothetical protein
MLIKSVIVRANNLKWGNWKGGTADCNDVAMKIWGLI